MQAPLAVTFPNMVWSEGMVNDRSSLSAWDDYPVHQIPEVIRHVGTSDRNFYDRYYFNLHACDDRLFVIFGMGQYPNLAVQDAFACATFAGKHHVVRASRVLGDRMDTSVGPFRIEVQEPLKRLRFVLEPGDYPIACDLQWLAHTPAYLEPRQFIRKYGRVLFDTQRFAQTGFWTGWLKIGSEEFRVTADRWWGTRDRSWGVRPVGEPEHPGIRQNEGQLTGLWNYAPMQFSDYAILYMVNEHEDGQRPLEEAVRIWVDPARAPEPLGRPEHCHHLIPGTRMIQSSRLLFPQAPGGKLEIEVTPLLNAYVAVGTGYGMEPDWRHGMYQGPLVVQGFERPIEEVASFGQYGLVDQVARFTTNEGAVGYGLHEFGFWGPFRPYGLADAFSGASSPQASGGPRAT
ncbi:MAG: hypothetical protein KatS3mg077_2397 [Candidatus Binatia bacterium]|nr:MAG: hypothetical protein KatS3mg077_2397 [Candidatus Binatia bacterium]